MSSSRRPSRSRSGKAAKKPASRTGGARSVLPARGEVAPTAKRSGRLGVKPQRKPAPRAPARKPPVAKARPKPAAKAVLPAHGEVAPTAKRSGRVGVKPQSKPAPNAKTALPSRGGVGSAPLPPKPKSSIRLGGSSRLTIKPGPPGALRPTLTLSTKERPGGPRPLSDVELDEDEVLIDGFDAILDGVQVRITAVLERTCVYIDSSGDRRLASKKDLVVEADKLPIRRRGLG